MEADNPADAAGIKQARLLDICASAQSVMETALKSLIHALEGDHPNRTRNIGGLIRHAAASGLTGPQARRPNQNPHPPHQPPTNPHPPRIGGD